MPFIGAPSPKDYDILETISDRKTYTGDGVKRVFGVSYHDNHISVFQNGLKLAEGIDYNIASSGQYITFVVAPESGDLIDLIGAVGVTNLSQSSYQRETFVATAGQNNVVLSSTIDDSVRMNVYVNGIRLTETDYTINNAAKTITFINNLAVDDTIAVDIFRPGFRIQSLQLTDLGISDGANNQVLTTNGNGVFYFADANVIDGNQKEFVATGSISSGDIVGLRSDGTVEAIANGTKIYTSSAGTPVVFESDMSSFISATFDTNTNKVVIAYQDVNNSNHGTAVVGTVSGDTISFGTPVVFGNAILHLGSDVEITFDSNANKVVIAYSDANNSNYGTAIVGTVSGDTISFGTPVAYGNTRVGRNMLSVIFDSNVNKIVIVYRDDDNLYSGTAIVGTVSGNTISFGTPVVFDTNINRTEEIGATFDSNTNKVVIVYQGSTNYGHAIVGTVSGDTISFGTPTVFSSSIYGSSITFDSNTNNVVVAYATFPRIGTAIVGTVSGNTISFGTPVVIGNIPSNYLIEITFDSNTNKVVIAYADEDNSNYGTVIEGTVSGNTISFGTSTVFESAYAWVGSPVFDSNTNKVVIPYGDAGNSNYGTASVFQTEGTIITTTANSWIGIAAENTSSGNNVKIDFPGKINSNQTGLVRNSIYYITESGSLTTTPTDYGIVGKAIDSNSIQIFAETSLTKLFDVNTTATANQVLTTDGTGNFFFAGVPRTLTNLNITDGTSGQVLKTYGNNTFYFADEENLNAILYSIALG